MAGSYPDVPGYRFAYDVDGTVVVNETGAVVSSSVLRTLNSDTVGTNTYNNGSLIYLFPEYRTITGVFLRRNVSASTSVAWSMDTTSGLDGTWTESVISSSQIIVVGVRENSRSHIIGLDIENIKGLKFYGASGSYRAVHLYGTIGTTQSPDRLRVVDQSNVDITSQLDFGNITQRSSSVREVKIINNSSSKSAQNITVSIDITNTATPALTGQIQLSTDNIAFANAVNIGNLAPGQSSATLYLRYSISPTAQLGPWESRIIAHPVSWS